MRKTINIGDLGTIITGKTPPTTNKNYYGDYAVFIKPTDISEQSKYTYETEEMYSKLAAEKYESSLIPKGAICVPCIGTIGTKMTMTPCDCYTNQSINSIICNENYDNEYVYYLIKNFLPGLKAYNLGTASVGKISVDVIGFISFAMTYFVLRVSHSFIISLISTLASALSCESSAWISLIRSLKSTPSSSTSATPT